MLGGGPQGALAGGGGGRGAGRGADTMAGGAGARVPGGGIQAGRARSAPWKSCRSGVVPLFPFWVQRTHFEEKETEAGRVVCRGKRGVGLGLSGPSFSTEPGSGKRPFPETALVRPAAIRRSWRRTKASRTRALAGCGDPHTRLPPEVQLKLGLHPTSDLEGGGWGWDREHSAGTSLRGRSANNFTSHFRLGDGDAHSPALERPLRFHLPARGSRCQFCADTGGFKWIVALQE